MKKEAANKSLSRNKITPLRSQHHRIKTVHRSWRWRANTKTGLHPHDGLQ